MGERALRLAAGGGGGSGERGLVGEVAGVGAGGDGDVALLSRVARGETGALGVLAGRHEGVMLGVARGLVGGLGGGEVEAVDCVQDAWVRVMRSAGTYRGEGSVRAWLVRVVVNVARDGRRSSRRRRAHAVRSWLARGGRDGAAGLGDGVSGGGGGVSGGVERDEALRSALSGIAARDRELVLLCCCRGLTQVEAAEVLGLPVGTLKTRLYRVLGELRAALGDEDERGAMEVER